MQDDERKLLIDQLARSFDALSLGEKMIVKHALAAPTHHPLTGKAFESFSEILESAADSTLLTLKVDFEYNGQLLPPLNQFH